MPRKYKPILVRWEVIARQHHVCFSCRIAHKVSGTCSRCRGPLVMIGDKLRPPKTGKQAGVEEARSPCPKELGVVGQLPLAKRQEGIIDA